MRIAVVDDEKAQSALLCCLAENWGRDRGESVQAAVFESAEQFLFSWAEDRDFDLLLLDIQMSGISGMELAKRLRSAGEMVPIVFITGLTDYLPDGYEVQALHYLIKPVEEGKLRQCFDRALQQEEGPPPLLVMSAQGARRIPQRELICVEAFAHSVSLKLLSGEAEAPMSIGEVQQKLVPADFVRCHRSYLVGLRHVSAIVRDQDGIWVHLDNGGRVPVSRRLYKEVNEAFIRYYHKLESHSGGA